MSYSAETERIWLEPLTFEEHLHDFHEIWANPEAVKFIPRAARASLSETIKFMPELLPSAENPEIDKFAILIRPTSLNIATYGEEALINAKGKPKMIGMTGTNRWCQQGMETGYCLNVKFWGKGFATEAMETFLKLYWEIPERKHINPLIAKTDAKHVASHKVLKKLGARKGEVLLESMKSENGERPEKEYYWYFDRPGFEAENLAEFNKRKQAEDVKDHTEAVVGRSQEDIQEP